MKTQDESVSGTPWFTEEDAKLVSDCATGATIAGENSGDYDLRERLFTKAAKLNDIAARMRALIE